MLSSEEDDDASSDDDGELSDELDRSSAALTESGESGALGELVTELEMALTACSPRMVANTVARAQPAMSNAVRRTLQGWPTATSATLKPTLNRG